MQPVEPFRVAALSAPEHFPAPFERLRVFALAFLREAFDIGVCLGPERREPPGFVLNDHAVPELQKLFDIIRRVKA